MNLASSLVTGAEVRPDRMALRLEDDTVSYRQLDQDSARVAGLLHDRGVRPGDRVAIMLPNVPEFARVYFGVLRAAGVVVPMNPLLKAREVGYFLGDSGAYFSIVDRKKHLGEEVGAVVALKPGATATADELRAYVKRQVAACKYPRKVWLVEALPKNATGKIVKREIAPPADLGGR